jgi:hypothetical protein
MADDHWRVVATIFERIAALNCGLFDERNPKRRCEEQLRASERGRGYAVDCELVLVDLDRPADYIRVAVKIAMPVGIAEHNVGSAVDAFVV